MKVAVIGGRTFNDYELVKETLTKLDITLLVSGGAKGADSLGERYASENNITTLIYKPFNNCIPVMSELVKSINL